MNIHITVEHDDMLTKRYSASIKTTDILHWAFAPMATVSPDCRVFSPEAVSDQEEERVVRMRKGAAEKLAKTLADHLVNAMKAEDTHNGYRLVEET